MFSSKFKFLQSVLSFLFVLQIPVINFAHAENKQVINIGYLTLEKKVPPALSNLDPFIKDKGSQGALLGIKDNNTTSHISKNKGSRVLGLTHLSLRILLRMLGRISSGEEGKDGNFGEENNILRK